MHHNNLLIKKAKNLQTAGFGLIELLVSISIVVLVTSVILVRHTSYNGAVLLRSEAYEMALQTREIQLTAVSVVGDVGDFRNVFGLYFNTLSPNFYYTFRDVDGNSFYDNGEEVGKRSNVDLRFEIGEIRFIDGGSESIESDVAIIFERPNFDAQFFTAANIEANASVSAVEIDVRVKGSDGTGVGEVRTVEITKTGQITVQ